LHATRRTRRVNPALDGVVPLELAATDLGVREIHDLIDRLEHGVVS
jgi:RES domain-containing protein